jgi:hypothetical protein
MSVGDVLDRGLKIFFARFFTFYAINLIAHIPTVTIDFLFDEVRGMDQVLAGLLLSLVTFFFYLMAMGAFVKVVEQEYFGKRIGAGGAFAFVVPRSFYLLLAALIVGIAFFAAMLPSFCLLGLGGIPNIFGIILLIILALAPLAYAAATFCMIGMAITLERGGPIAGLVRSVILTNHYKWRLIGLIFVTFVLLQSGAQLVVHFSLEEFLPGSRFIRNADGIPQMTITDRTNYLINLVITNLVGMVFSSYSMICLTLAYFDLRVRKEGFDLEYAARGFKTAEQQYDEEDERDEPRRRKRSRFDDHDEDNRKSGKSPFDFDDRDDIVGYDDDRPRRPRRPMREDDEDEFDSSGRRRRPMRDDEDDFRPRRY